MLLMLNLLSKSKKSVELSIKGNGMSRLAKMSLSCKIILSSSVPRSREGSEDVQLCAVMIGRPLSQLRLEEEAVEDSLCTLGRGFM